MPANHGYKSRRLWPGAELTGSIVSDKIGHRIYVCVRYLRRYKRHALFGSRIPLKQRSVPVNQSRFIVDPDTGFLYGCRVFGVRIFEVLCLIVQQFGSLPRRAASFRFSLSAVQLIAEKLQRFSVSETLSRYWSKVLPSASSYPLGCSYNHLPNPRYAKTYSFPPKVGVKENGEFNRSVIKKWRTAAEPPPIV